MTWTTIVSDIVKAKSMLMPAMTNVTKTLSHVQKIVRALEIVQMVAHAVMMKLTVQIGQDYSYKNIIKLARYNATILWKIFESN